MRESKESFLQKIYQTSPDLFKRPKLNELVRVYQDLEKTLKGLKASAERAETHLSHINVRKLILQLSRSKRRLERKIGNTILLEKQHLKRKFRTLTTNLSARERAKAEG